MRKKAAFISVPTTGTVVASAEMFIAAPDCLPTIEHLTAVLPRVLGSLADAIRTFIEDLATVNNLETAITH